MTTAVRRELVVKRLAGGELVVLDWGTAIQEFSRALLESDSPFLDMTEYPQFVTVRASNGSRKYTLLYEHDGVVTATGGPIETP